jgi:hypothetical protein
MKTHPTLAQELWERTPAAVRAYIEALEARQAAMGDLEARVATLEALVHALQAQLNQTSRHSSRPPSSDPPLRVSAVTVGNPGTLVIRAHSCL